MHHGDYTYSLNDLQWRFVGIFISSNEEKLWELLSPRPSLSHFRPLFFSSFLHMLFEINKKIR